MKTAREIRRLNWRGDARLYRLSEPHEGYDYVVVSALTLPDLPGETSIFGSDATGECDTMEELPGSFEGGLDHAKALARAGYTILPGGEA